MTRKDVWVSNLKQNMELNKLYRKCQLHPNPDFKFMRIGGDDVVVVHRKEAVKTAKEKYPNHILYSILEVEALANCTEEEIDLLHFTKKTFSGAICDEKTTIHHRIIKEPSDAK